jgi:8-oxo-dGTP diphosphatase
VWLIGSWEGSASNRAPDEHDEIAWVSFSELGGLRLAHGDLTALIGRLPEAGRLPPGGDARSAGSPSRAEVRRCSPLRSQA